MERIRTRFIIAVTERLASAADSTAKVELIEELSDNLYQRFQELLGNGVPEEEAYRQALEDLGDVEELLAYLESLGPDGSLPRQESAPRGFTEELFQGVESIVRETVSQTRDAVDQAADIVKGGADKIKDKYPDGFKGKVYVHFDGDDAHAGCGEASETAGEPEPARDGNKGWSFSVGYNRDRGGFFCENGRSRRLTGTAFPSPEIKGIDVQVINGDVTINLDDDPEADVVITGEAEELEARLSDSGVLSIRQGKTASRSFFFNLGLDKADVELTIPRRLWESIQISTTSGDVGLDSGLEVDRLSIKTASGDTQVSELRFRELFFKSASGDLDADGLDGQFVHAESASGDIDLTGRFDTIEATTASGEIEVADQVRCIRCSSASGDIEVRTALMPDQLELSSKSGDCEAAIPEGQGFALRFSTVSGELDTGFPLVGPLGSRSGEAMYLDGGGRSYRMSTVSGDLTIRPL